jgi:hypothetical protein
MASTTLLLASQALTLVAADPPGSNGTITVDGLPFDWHPDTEPHVGCDVQVDFAGFDAADAVARVSFAAQPPSGTTSLLPDDEVPIGGDPAGGATDLDAERSYRLDLSGLLEHPTQGYHVKLTISVPSPKGDTKSKVFWVQGCAPTPSDGEGTDPDGGDGRGG